jgi:hypothetical protein
MKTRSGKAGRKSAVKVAEPAAPAALAAAGEPRSCYILGNARGEWWTGSGWSRDLAASRRYAGEPDPDREARDAAREVQALTGERCNVYFVPADQAPMFFRRGRGAGSRAAG